MAVPHDFEWFQILAMVGRAPLNIHGLTSQEEALVGPKGKEEAN